MSASMEPHLVVAAHLVPVLEELKRLEPLFHGAAVGATPQWFEELVTEEFWEVGASGRRYSREFALGVLKTRGRDPTEDEWVTSGFHVSEVAPDNYLLTYTLQQPGRLTRRMTLWRRAGQRWKAVYHQGTVVQDAG
jgi:hypothetical protein